MKKLLLILGFCALVLGLYAQNDSRRNNLDSSTERITHVSATEAQEVGYVFLRSSSNGTRGGSLRKQDMQLVYTGTAADGTDCYYVFALQPTGFVIVSADERVKPILGYSYTNNFVVEDMPINVVSWLDNYKKQIKAVVDNNYQSDMETRTTWTRLKAGQATTDRSGTSVAPLLQTTWNQNCYYNQLCPVDSSGPCNRVYAGCVATAMAQVMRYWEWPNQGFNSHSYTCDYGTLSVDFTTGIYNYDNMPNAVNYSTSASQKEEVAKLIYHCGVAVDMDYGPDGSGAYSSDVPAALYNYFAYTDNGSFVYKSSYSETNWANLIKQELDNMRPVYYSGHGSGGHAFVCDGYDENGLFHFNWGWSGSSDGYFELSTLNPSTHDFSSSQAAVIGIKSAGTFMRCSDTELSFSARVGEQSTIQTITVCGHGLSGSISVSASSGFKVSKNGVLFYSSLTLPASGGKLYVKYVPTQSGDVTGTLTLTAGSYSLEVTLNGTDNVIVGTGTATNNYLPSNSYYKYALTQQIYTPAEIGTSGYINSIAFYNSGTEKTRNYDMYLVLTDKATFDNATDWIPITEDDKVFSGEIIMADSVWTVLNIDNFAYDGVSNLALIMDDNTGSYSSGMACRVFDAANKTLRVCSDNTNYDPANPGIYSGTVDNQKNQIKINITPADVVICEKPNNLTFSNITSTAASVSWSGGSGTFGYEYKKASDASWTSPSGNCGYNCSLSDLSPNTAYQFRVHAFCDNDTSKWLNGSFTTLAEIPFVEPFDKTGLPTGWERYTGLLNSVMDGTATLATTTSGWVFGTGNGVFDSHARTNIYGTSWNKWLITPTLRMENNVELSFDLALTKYSGTLQPVVDSLQQDDRFVVLITNNNGANWTVLRQWDNAGSEYVYNNIPCSANGEKIKINLSSYAGQNIAIAFYGESTVSGGDNYLHIDNVTIEHITSCEKPSAVTVSDISAHSATISWESDASEWIICLNNSQNNTIQVDENPYVLTDLNAETQYSVKVLAICDGGESNWSVSKTFTTTEACPAPTNLTCTASTTTTATLSWFEGDASAWQLCLDNDEQNLINVHTVPFTLSGLAPSTTYSFKVRALCDSASPWSSVANFNTVFAIPLVEPFNNTSIPAGWSLYTGLMSNVMAGTASLASATSGWTFGANNGVFDNHARTNIYGSSWNKWLVTPSLSMENNVQLSFDLALTKYSGTLLPVVDTLQQDDKFVVLITTDNGSTWNVLRQWDNAGSEYVYNHIACSATGEKVIIDLSSYAGQNIAIAFYGESTVSGNGDNNLHIDNVSIDYIPFCPLPTELTINYYSGTTARVLWNGDAESYHLNVNDEMYETTSSPYILTGLEPNATYVVRIQADCGDELFSEWTETISFTTDGCSAIALNADNNFIWSDDFESYTTSTTASTGIEPTCWVLVQEDVTMPSGKKPQLCYKSSYAHSGNYSLKLNYRGIYAMPNLSLPEEFTMSQVVMKMYLRQPNAVYQLEVGVLEENGTFVPVTLINNSTTDIEHVVCDFSNYTGNGHRIAFHNVLDNGVNINYSLNYIDDIVLSLPVCGAITLPYSETFEDITDVTTASTGVEPGCWELVRIDATSMPDDKRPQVYYRNDFAHSGSYSLLLNYRGVYAMPAMAEDVTMQNVKLEMYLRQANAAYQLEVGVWDDATNTFMPVVLLNNATTGVEHVMCDFSSYTGNGRRIAFHNVLGSGKTWNYSYNYLDDITLTLLGLDDCTVSPSHTETFEDYTTVTTAATGTEPDCWELVQEDVQMPDNKKPQLYYRSDFAHSGNYSLLLNYRGVYAMPNLDVTDANISDLHLSMYLRQPNAAYTLEVGVWEPGDDSEETGVFVPVHVFNNKTTDVTFVECDFSNYMGDGGRIAFRNTLTSGKTWSYSYNYLDDITLTRISNNKSAEVTDANAVDALTDDLDWVDVVVYPNPTKDVVNVQCTMNNVQCSGIEIVDVYGKIITTVGTRFIASAQSPASAPTQINVSGLAAGMYFVRVTTDKGVVTRPFVKR